MGGMESDMLRVFQGEKFAIFKAAIHISAALVIAWYLYRIACGQLTPL
jgi:hypothetical protein